MGKFLNKANLPPTVGGMAIIYGTWGLFSAINLSLSGNKYYDSMGIESIDLLEKFNFQILADIGFIVTEWGLIRFSPWARYFFFISIVTFFVPSLFYSALFYGQMISLN